MMNNYHNVLNAFYNQPWAITQRKFDSIDAVLRMRMKGAQPIEAADFKAEFEAAEERRQTRTAAGGVAVIPIVGTIMHRAGMFEASGGISVQTLQKQISSAMDNSAVGSIVFDVDSPGGSVSGVPELAEVIRSFRGQGKPMIGVANTLMASAAFWIGAQFDEIVASPSSEVGSVGVVVKHADISEFDKMVGQKVTFITNTTSPNKAAGNSHEPLSEETFDELQSMVDAFADKFETALAKGRGVSVSKVRSSFGGGKIFNAEDAKANGLVDRIGTLDETIARMAKRGAGGRARASRQREIDMI